MNDQAESGAIALRHVVMWALKDPADAPRFAALLQSCAQVVPGILEFDVHCRVQGLEATADVLLVSTFASEQALAEYQAHPHHQAVAKELGAMRLRREVVDSFCRAA
jgi:quinol monooxygenase YgiN